MGESCPLRIPFDSAELVAGRQSLQKSPSSFSEMSEIVAFYKGLAIIGLACWITIGDAVLQRSKPQKGHAKPAHVQDYGISTSPT
jgi:hypothetical protein